MEKEDVVHVLRRFREALVPGGIVLDLQVIRPDPRVEVDGAAVCEIDGSPLLELADAAAGEVDRMVAEGLLVEHAVDDHDVLKHYASGRELVEEWEPKERTLPPEAIPLLLRVERPCAVRERCRLRRLSRT